MIDPTASPPPPVAGGKIFTRTTFRERTVLGCSAESEQASGGGLIPGLVVYANREGYAWLSDLFRWLSTRRLPSPDGPEPGGPVAIYDLLKAPWDYEMSDDLDIEFETLTPENQAAILRATGFTPENRKRGDPFQQFVITAGRLIRHIEMFGAEDAEAEYGPTLVAMRELGRVTAEGLARIDAVVRSGGGPAD